VPLFPWLKEFISRVEEKFANAFAYEIYTAAPFNQSLQPTKNLHFSPSTPTQGTYREKMESEIKEEKMKKKTRRNYKSQSIPILSPTMPNPSFPRGFILDGSQMKLISAVLL